jgi:hypothetical protein
MQLKTIFNHVVDYKPFVVDKVELIGEMPNRIEITMRSRGNGQAVCSGCGQRRPGYDRRRSQATVMAWPRSHRENVTSFFRFLGKDLSQALRFVCSDTWQAYLKVIAKKAPQGPPGTKVCLNHTPPALRATVALRLGFSPIQTWLSPITFPSNTWPFGN